MISIQFEDTNFFDNYKKYFKLQLKLYESIFFNFTAKIIFETFELETCEKSHFKYITTEDYLYNGMNKNSLCIPKDQNTILN